MTALPRTFVCRDESATIAAGEQVGRALAGGEILSLEGDLGLGKTVFVRGLARALGHAADAISSPSFVLAIEHAGGRIPLLHVDLYRLPEGSGIDDLGIEEALGEGWVVAVEWGERLPTFLKRAAVRVVFAKDPMDGEDARAITVISP